MKRRKYTAAALRLAVVAEMLKKISTHVDNINHRTSKFSYQYRITKIVFDVLASINVKTSKTLLANNKIDYKRVPCSSLRTTLQAHPTAAIYKTSTCTKNAVHIQWYLKLRKEEPI